VFFCSARFYRKLVNVLVLLFLSIIQVSINTKAEPVGPTGAPCAEQLPPLPASVEAERKNARRAIQEIEDTRNSLSKEMSKLSSEVLFYLSAASGKPNELLPTGMSLSDRGELVLLIGGRVNDELRQAIINLGGRILYKNSSDKAISAWVPLGQVKTLAKLDSVSAMSVGFSESSIAQLETIYALRDSFSQVHKKLPFDVVLFLKKRAGDVAINKDIPKYIICLDLDSKDRLEVEIVTSESGGAETVKRIEKVGGTIVSKDLEPGNYSDMTHVEQYGKPRPGDKRVPIWRIQAFIPVEKIEYVASSKDVLTVDIVAGIDLVTDRKPALFKDLMMDVIPFLGSNALNGEDSLLAP